MQNAPITKYRPFPTISLPERQWPGKTISNAPIWCSVDLRDGNQALACPMGIHEKLEMFQLLVSIGFKEIEIGFPSASDTEFAFCRKLIEENLIPDDVSVQVLVQCREHLIRRTFDALRGTRRAIIHIYNSTSPLQRRITFGNASCESIKQIAQEGAALVKTLAPSLPGMRLQYSPESFSDTEPEYALEVCEAVMDIWEPTTTAPIILNLPETVQWTTPNVYADQIEWFAKHLSERDKAILSLHTHNDRGTGVAATELALMAGAQRVEGTLFGNGERTGNLDIVTVALNMYTHGIHPKLKLDKLADIRRTYERCTRMNVHERHPYAGDLVFTAFSGSHQDAIKKGMDRRAQANDNNAPWEVPYLTIDPQDIGSSYEAIIRINSQSGKGGIAYILHRDYGLDLPKAMHPQVGNTINAIADAKQRELTSAEIHQAFHERFVNLASPLQIGHFEQKNLEAPGGLAICAQVTHRNTTYTLHGQGNGPINAFVNAIEAQGWKNFLLVSYHSEALGIGSAANAAAYVALQRLCDKEIYWGCGIDSSIERASLFALISAFNRVNSQS
ncbi:MAG: 2-isopropylmalate synthase [Puniceicoccales bacterium]|jgi:2-isopropylmalate synthase|nr:2-isopropylmalate synthase [Puniceicoccales bacterium]